MRNLRSVAATLSLVLSCLIGLPSLTSAQTPVPPTGIAILTFEDARQAGGPVWVHIKLPVPYEVQYPVGIVPGDLGCNEFEVRRDGVLLPRRVPNIKDMPPRSGLPCGHIGIAGHPMKHPGRLPLHLQYALETPGTYEVRYLRKSPEFGSMPGQVQFQSAWTPVEIHAGSSMPIGIPPQDPAEILSDFLPGILGYPDRQKLTLVAGYLHHPIDAVRRYAAYGLSYWPDEEVLRSLTDLVRSKGPSDVLVDRVGPAAPDLSEAMVRYLASSDPVLVRGALEAASKILYYENTRDLFSDAIRTATENALLKSAENIVLVGDEQTVINLAATLGSLHNGTAHALLWDFVSRRVAYQQSLTAITWHKDMKDLVRLSAILDTPAAGNPVSTELSTLPYALRKAYGKAALPVLESALRNSGYVWVRTSSARELVEENHPSGFAFIAEAIEQNQRYKREMTDFIRGQFPELRNAAETDVLAFLRMRGSTPAQ
jgi:hypothetical protein